MEKIKKLLKEEEKIIWSGSPDKFALKPNYIFARIYILLFIFFIIIAMLLTILYIPAFMFFVIPIITGIIILMSALLGLLYKRRHHKDVFYLITTQRVFIDSPLIHEGSMKIGDSMEELVIIDDGDYRNYLFFYKSAINRNESVISIDLSMIKEIQIKPGQRGYDFFFTCEVNGKIMKFKFSAIVEGYIDLVKTLSNMQYKFKIIES